MLDQFIDLLLGYADNPAVQWVVIVVGTFILEDVAVITAAILAAEGSLSIGVAVPALYCGIALGDMGLYLIGHLSDRLHRAFPFISQHRLAKAQAYLHQRAIAAVVVSRFVPGMRLPTYFAAGFLHLPFLRFMTLVLLATAAWTALLFSASYVLGDAMNEIFGIWKWPLLALVLGGLILYHWTRTLWKRRSA
jgi:membrane protein DedA with SNARE-associated domain